MAPLVSPPQPEPSAHSRSPRLSPPQAPASPKLPASGPDWWLLARQRSVVQRALRTSLLVGTILVGINHGDALLRRDCPPDRLAKIGLTYMVPYLVATFASVSTLRELGRSPMADREENGN
ncbi:MAG: nitrate/nitrite transporter NrtS [Limnothrix sp.]|uniref:nitrate/nitrite transporter NrtS n=1 Tax=unclassified Limnothrix TaxID=2632864 RepID=UPI001179CF94|nr:MULTISPECIES: nitrate/nitrite transporter NrtS [unclassified Limnothrix]MBD2635533.1 nitrate/nitrite transporter NrtS [Limnothrix sp. FACHB-881]MEB3116873.1 nitrate/nitrite transporter NrtS [Limnothrix sp.]